MLEALNSKLHDFLIFGPTINSFHWPINGHILLTYTLTGSCLLLMLILNLRSEANTQASLRDALCHLFCL